jgi:hypothetical protein
MGVGVSRPISLPVRQLSRLEMKFKSSLIILGLVHTYSGQDGVEKTSVEVVLEKLAILDPMPKGVREALDFQNTQ